MLSALGRGSLPDAFFFLLFPYDSTAFFDRAFDPDEKILSDE